MSISDEIKNYWNNFLNTGCIVNGAPCDLKEIERMG